mmetsp:Transcript_49846/g.123929  ORF Transcript_49846/g.123929 Transcript_49846/m.123929 type:complete len:126 (+) Transcript_49846:276-653(+)
MNAGIEIITNKRVRHADIVCASGFLLMHNSNVRQPDNYFHIMAGLGNTTYAAYTCPTHRHNGNEIMLSTVCVRVKRQNHARERFRTQDTWALLFHTKITSIRVHRRCADPRADRLRKLRLELFIN